MPADCSPRPRWATPRSPDRQTLGAHAATIATKLGRPFLPWQREVADVAFELLPNGHLAYGRVVVTVPRQQGKTVLALGAVLLRSLGDRDQFSVYAAQSGVEGRRKWRDDWLPLLHPFGAEANMANGSEAIRFPTGSVIRLHSGSEAGIHGASVDFACCDEAWAYSDSRHEAAILPAMMARPNPQLWIVSTAGVANRGFYLANQVERGRQAVEADIREGIAFFEWSADPTADPADPETWRSCMPALGRTVDEAFVRDAQRSMPAHEFRRAFLNLESSGSGDAIVDLGHWNSLADPSAPRPDWVVLGVDVGPQGKSASIVAVGEDKGLLRAAVLEHNATSSDWLLPALARRYQELGRPMLIVDAKACAGILPELERLSGFQMRALGPSDVPPACAFWLRLVNESKLRHRGEQELTIALDGAGQRSLGDGWAWSRRNSGCDITPLVATTLATSFWLGPWGS